MRTLGIIAIVLGIIMIAYTGFDFITTEKVVDVGPVQINKEVNHPVQWSPIVGGILLVGGILTVLLTKKSSN